MKTSHNQMRPRAVVGIVIGLSLFVLLTFKLSSPVSPRSPVQLSFSRQQLPLSFEINQGQTDPQVKFRARGEGYQLFLTNDEAVMRSSHAAIRLKLSGANPRPQISGEDPLPGQSNYFYGDRPEEWRIDVANYRRVRYSAVYSGIDLVYYGSQRKLEYDFIVAPGADPQAIRLKFSEPVQIDEQGDLIVQSSDGELRQHKPIVYQEIEGTKHAVEGEYLIESEGEVRFEIGEYDCSRPLTIDPVLAYSSYLGGSLGDEAGGVSRDREGNVYLVGNTLSANFPIAGNAYRSAITSQRDIFVTKLRADGRTLVYSTYIGGAARDQFNEMNAQIAVDGLGNAIVTGLTSGVNFPLTNAYQGIYGGGSSDAFAFKLNANGSGLIYSTFLGGLFGEGVYSLALDANGNAYLAGFSQSPNFPTTDNAYQKNKGDASSTFSDGVVMKLNSAGSVVFATYLGGIENDIAYGAAFDAAGQVYVAGTSRSNNFPTTSDAYQIGRIGGFDAFIARLNPAGSSLQYATFLGGSGNDAAFAVAVNGAGQVQVMGQTASIDFPTSNALQPQFGGGSGASPYSGDVFVAKFNPAIRQLIYSTYLGGNSDDRATSFALDPAGNAYLGGQTFSSNFPSANSVQQLIRGTNDAFVTKLSEAGAVIYSTFFGGDSSERINGLLVDAIGNVYAVGATESSNLLTTTGSYQRTIGGASDALTVWLAADAVTVSAASYSGAAITSKSIAAAFGPSFAGSTAFATTQPLPTTLAGASVRIKDSAGAERLAPLFFVSPTQVNYQIPDGTAVGPASVTATGSSGRLSTAAIQVAAAAPSLFTADNSGLGAVAAVDAFTGAAAPFNARQSNGDPNIIAVFGTGLGADATDVDGNVAGDVQARIDGNLATLLYAGRAPGFVGLNQFNVVFPAGIGSGTHTLTVSRQGATSNQVAVLVK